MPEDANGVPKWVARDLERHEHLIEDVRKENAEMKHEIDKLLGKFAVAGVLVTIVLSAAIGYLFNHWGK